MTIGWIMVGALAVGLAYLLVFALAKVASDADRAAREARPDIYICPEITVTQWPTGRQ